MKRFSDNIRDLTDRTKVSYNGVWKVLRRYWGAYEGFPALVSSPYFHTSMLLTVILSMFGGHPEWANISTSILPAVLGFSVGGYAILLAFGEPRFFKTMMNVGKDYSAYARMNATFVHFILTQIVALLLGVFGLIVIPECGPTGLGWLLSLTGMFFLFYALATAVALTLAIFRLAQWFEWYGRRQD